MAAEMINRFVTDVKCCYFGHVSGQIIGKRHEPLTVKNFVPRPGYKGLEVRPGTRLRCERCQGPVFLEDVSSMMPVGKPASRKAASSSKIVERRGRKAA